MQKKVLSVSESKDNNSITIKHLGKRRYSSKVEYYKQCCANTDRPPPRKKYKKFNRLRDKSIKAPRQNLLVMKWDPPIKLTFD
jgi:hypothetical protein